jgi:hypothetical protein
MHTTVRVIGLVGVVGLLGCGTAPEPEGQDRGAPVSATRIADGLPEYRHTPERSRMLTGPNSASRFEDGLEKVVGDWGTLAIDPANGYSQGVPNAGVAMLDVAPFGSTLAEHSDHVKAMFVTAGVPLGEIGSVQGSVGGGFGGRAGEDAKPVGNRWYTSTLTRMTDGIPVADSFAWARIDERDEVVSESVYWPSIPQRVIDQAEELRARLEAPGQRESFARRLPLRDMRAATAGHVAIRHSSAVAEGAFEAYALYDVVTRDGKGTAFTQHFDASGVEVRLPQERRAPPSTPRRR